MINLRNQFLLILSIILLGASCTEDPCDNTICQNDGVCIEGDCDCLPGFEGDQCELLTSEKITGNFTVTSNCMGGSTETNEWAVSRSASAFNEVLISNFHYQGVDVFVTIIDANTLEIQRQGPDIPTDLLTVEGSGTIDAEGQMTLNYMLWGVASPDTISCTATAIRQ